MTDLPTGTVGRADRALLQRLKETVRPDRTFGTALRDAAAALHIRVEWHEADALAEALSHHYTHTVEVYRVIHPALDGPDARRIANEDLRHELALTVFQQGYALVEEPVETVHVADEVGFGDKPLRKSKPVSLEQAQAIIDRSSVPCPAFPVAVLTGRCRKLAKAS